MTAPGDPRTGRRWMALVAAVIQRDHGRCWRCGRLGADTGGHVLPWSTHPHLALNRDNIRAEHGRKRTAAIDGYDCPGNYGSGARDTERTGDATHLATQRRDWLTQHNE